MSLHSFNGLRLSQNVDDADRSAHEVITDNLADIYPEASPRQLADTICRADELVDAALEKAGGHTDDIGRLVLTASALAVTLQGGKGIFGRWKDGVVPKGRDPQKFWDTLVEPRRQTTVVQGRRSAKEIIFGYAVKDDPHSLEVMSTAITELSGTGGLFEGLSPNVEHLYLLQLDDDTMCQAYQDLLDNGQRKDLGVSSYLSDYSILLGVEVSRNLHADGDVGANARGVLMHELGHAFTAGLSDYDMLGDRHCARIPSEMLAEHGRLKLGYPSRSYTAERSLQYSINDALGYDLIDTVIADFRQEPNSGDNQALLKNYAARLVQIGGVVAAGLVLGALPENYIDESDSDIRAHDITLLDDTDIWRFSLKRYPVISRYVPEGLRPTMLHGNSIAACTQKPWEMPSDQALLLRQLAYGFSASRATVRIL